MGMISRIFLILSIIALHFIQLSALSGREVFIDSGHYDLAVNYLSESGWHPYVFDFEGKAELEPWRVVLQVTEASERNIPASAAFSFLGEAGDPFWVIPEVIETDEIDTRLWLGLGSPLLQRGIFAGGFGGSGSRGRITLRLVEVSGTGPDNGGEVFLYSMQPGPVIHFSSSEQAGGEGVLELVGGGHTHYNWAFTAPGLYRVTFEWAGTLTEEWGGAATSTRVTHVFEVLHAGSSSPLRYAWSLGEGWQWSSWMGTVYSAQPPWVFAPGVGWLYLPDGDPELFWIWLEEHGWSLASQQSYPWIWSGSLNAWVEL